MRKAGSGGETPGRWETPSVGKEEKHNLCHPGSSSHSGGGGELENI